MTAVVVRRYTFKLYPSAAQEAVLHEQAGMMVDLWNALLQRHEDIYRRTRGQRGVVHGPGRSPTFFDMTAEITRLRAACPEWAALSVWSAHRVARSLDEAFKAFYRRAKAGAGAQSGYPRYRARRRADAIPHRFASGCKLLPASGERSGDAETPGTARMKNWRLTLKGVPGVIRARGELPVSALDWKDADVILRDGAWWLSACVEVAPRRVPGRDALTVHFDLIDEFARVERADGRRTAADGVARDPTGNPHRLNELEDGPSNVDSAGEDVRGGQHRKLLSDLRTSNVDSAGEDVRGVRHGEERRPGDANNADSAGGDVREVRRSNLHKSLHLAKALTEAADAIKSARDNRGLRRYSRKWRREERRAARLIGRAARIRREALHEWSTAVAGAASDLTVIAPTISEATASPHGDEREWGANVATVSKINRHVLNQAPAAAMAMLAYKAAEAGIRCDVITDEAPKIAVGAKLVAAGKATRKAKRAIRKEAQ